MKFIRHIFLLTVLIQMIALGTSFAAGYGPQHDKLVKTFQGNDEPTAKDAVWTAKDIFKVGVLDDGSRRDGYAQYVCGVVADEGFRGKGVWVQIIDVVKLNITGKWIKLGEAHCR
jgi:hypothetical protein